MDAIVNFYKSLDMINLIIFWGIIIVIILILILIFILIYKNKKSKKTLVNNTDANKYEEELPIKEESIISNNSEIESKQESAIFSLKQEDIFNEPQIANSYIKPDRNTKHELIIEQKQEIPQNNIIQENMVEKVEPTNNAIKQPIQMPTGPYQRNVLREMSLSQTSPIGINKKDRIEEKRNEMVKDLSSSLNHEQKEKYLEINNITKQELNKIENISPRRTETISEYPQTEKYNHIEHRSKIEHPIQTNKFSIDNVEKKDYLPKELLELDSNVQKEKSLSEQYLEEVSQKLSETEVNDGIERTHYELQQEEDAIISYKELMEKKDSIQTIDEEDAVISIEELMNRKNNKQQEVTQDTRLYNINETEENDDFIKELKQFRNDL